MRTSGTTIKTIGGSQVFTMRITDVAAEQIVVVFGLKGEKTIAEQFSYPAREGYSTIEKDEAVFSLQLSEKATAQVVADLLVADVKTWYVDGTNRVTRLNLAYVKTTYVSEIERVNT